MEFPCKIRFVALGKDKSEEVPISGSHQLISVTPGADNYEPRQSSTLDRTISESTAVGQWRYFNMLA